VPRLNRAQSEVFDWVDAQAGDQPSVVDLARRLPTVDTDRLLEELDDASAEVLEHLFQVAVRALGWYRQFRETILIFAITNIKPLCEPL
jgi:hypothetical protein